MRIQDALNLFTLNDYKNWDENKSQSDNDGKYNNFMNIFKSVSRFDY